MKRVRITSLVTAAVLLLALGVPMVGAQGQFVAATLSSTAENPPVLTSGAGAFGAGITAAGINATLGYDGLEGIVTAAHIHLGKPWENGGVAAFICANMPPPGVTAPPCPPSPGQLSALIAPAGVLEVTNEQGAVILAAGDLAGLSQAMLAGATYVNVHTDLHPSGEIRGNIAP